MDKKYELKKQRKIREGFVHAFSEFFVLASEGIYNSLKAIQNRSNLEKIENVPSTKEWLSYYRTENLFIESISKNLANQEFDFYGHIKNIETFEDLIDNLALNEDGTPKKTEEAISNFHNTLETFTEFFKKPADFFNSEIEPNSDKKTDHVALFLILVYIPCYFLFGKPPKVLFESAQQGSIDDIKKLIRLDPSVLGDPLIFEYFHQASLDPNRSTFKSMVYAIENPPKKNIKLQQVKMKIAGLISFASKAVTRKFNTPEIEMLFEKLSREINKEELTLIEIDDPDKVPFEESIAQRVRRSKQSWD